MFDDNLHTVFYLSRAAAPGMIERKWGRIVNFSIAKADQLVGQPFITGALHRQGGGADPDPIARQDTGAPRHHRQLDLTRFHRIPRHTAEEFAQLAKNIPAGYIGNPRTPCPWSFTCSRKRPAT